MAKKEKKLLEKKNWQNSFALIGEAKINQYTFKIDEKSEKSDWVYNQLNLGVDCGESSGTVYAELMGGYGAERDNILYVHGKNEDGKDDFENKFTIDWEDRFDEDIIESIGNSCFITVGIERDKNGKVFYKRFLSPYDAIAYVYENLEDGTPICVRGNLKYSTYNDNVQVRKEINRITLVKAEDKSVYSAKFTQTMLLTKDSLGKVDKSTGVLPIYAKVLDYVKEYKGKEVKSNIPFDKAFEYEVDLSKPEQTKKIVDKLFKVSKGVTEITFEGNLIEGGAMVTPTEDDLPDDIKELIEIGVYTLEEAIDKCTVNSGRERRMVLRKPLIKNVEGKDGTTTPVLQKIEKKYEEEDLILDFMVGSDNETDDNEAEIDDALDAVTSDGDAEDWLNSL